MVSGVSRRAATLTAKSRPRNEVMRMSFQLILVIIILLCAIIVKAY